MNCEEMGYNEYSIDRILTVTALYNEREKNSGTSDTNLICHYFLLLGSGRIIEGESVIDFCL